MVQITTDQLMTWVVSFMWPLSRILGLFSSAPLFSESSFPMMARIGMALAISILVAPVLPDHAVIDPFSFFGLSSLFNQFIIGITIGFVMRIFFTAIELTGDLISMSMGMGFATFYDPQTQAQTQVISQILTMVLILLFLNTDLHLLVIDSLVNSFYSVPIDQVSLNVKGFKEMAYLGAKIFSIGLQLSLPIVTALLITNIALGVLTKAAPQLNLFGIGFPVTMAIGLVMLLISIPYMFPPFVKSLTDGIETIRIITSNFTKT
jgi:flagellar biosynthetic protein FliR